MPHLLEPDLFSRGIIPAQGYIDSVPPLVPDPISDLFLRFVLGQARRRHEPLTIFDVVIDRLDAISSTFGPDLAAAAVDRVAEAIQTAIRGSDLVIRQESSGLLVLLPTASAENAAALAEVVRDAIARAGRPILSMPVLTASLGSASYPDHGVDPTQLREAAAQARRQAERQGHGCIHALPPADPWLG